jgi:hypothetical protein
LVPHDPPSLQDPPQLLWQFVQVQLETQLPLLQIMLVPQDPPSLQEAPLQESLQLLQVQQFPPEHRPP